MVGGEWVWGFVKSQATNLGFGEMLNRKRRWSGLRGVV
jgi:hypothetical protein